MAAFGSCNLMKTLALLAYRTAKRGFSLMAAVNKWMGFCSSHHLGHQWQSHPFIYDVANPSSPQLLLHFHLPFLEGHQCLFQSHLPYQFLDHFLHLMFCLSLCFPLPLYCFSFLDVFSWFSFMSSRWYFTPSPMLSTHSLRKHISSVCRRLDPACTFSWRHTASSLCGGPWSGSRGCGWGCGLIPGPGTSSVWPHRCELSFSCWFTEVIYFGYKSLVRYNDQYLLSDYGVPFYFLNVFWWTDIFNFNEVQFINFFFYG